MAAKKAAVGNGACMASRRTAVFCSINFVAAAHTYADSVAKCISHLPTSPSFASHG
eukprot:CAMPEP_0168389714 /NCGR_PEP_ID=MMETSP0228-20121227/17104_1 /TAXON_ID=133427 /ORGANISM="Protoceratium reticulatum, Strain CCCM 535 (=CCMP 1889)" /LENGTH=55 /DNA_ID=CAMNT_0008402991 /DNA_START=173 /DNA_END=337 /DNA_ORIENTATION=+